MKVLHFVNHSFPVVDGYSIRTRYVALSQRKLGIEPVIVTRPGFAQQCSTELKFRERVDDIPHFHFIGSDYPLVQPTHRLRKARKYFERRYAMKYYRRVIEECAPCSVFHVHLLPDLVSRLLLLSRKAKVPLVYEIRGLWEDTQVVCGQLSPNSPRYQRRRDASTQAANDADCVVTVSKGLRQDFISRGVPAEKISVVPNGVDTSLFVPRDRDAALAAKLGLTGQIVLGYISSLRQLEGLDHLIGAMPQILEAVPNGMCLVVGDGDYAQQLRSLVNGLGLQGKVILTGRVNHSEILAYYSLIDIFVTPRPDTRVNNLVTPLKPLEAMSMAKALLVSSVGGLKELVEDGHTGIVFEAGNSTDLASKAIMLAKDPELRFRLGAEARRYVTIERDWAAVIRAYPYAATEFASLRC